MSVSSLLALLSLFAIHLQLIFSLPNPDGHHGIIPHEPQGQWGHGPEIFPVQTIHLVWDRDLPIDHGKKVKVLSVETGHVLYLISQAKDDAFSTIISDGNGKQLLRFTLDKKAIIGFEHVYNTSVKTLRYEIHPKGGAADRWFMRIGEPPITLAYHRGRARNTGNVYLRGDKLAAFTFGDIAQVDKTQMKSADLKGVQNVVTYEIVMRSDIPEYYFIGLWCLSKRRIDHYGK
ncbi:hypothetical protein PtA15_4A780 [Puccinia triticina]|uniref:Glycoside hydrolase 131 catalytic N-terminal domain-containing protein n=1 Tax=Puccinia triticina TaxID=208348 RepID=A0ABY7CNG7_9BASI|nr:uncharacterized protein PtA15_4A780 [Puccinia triticina]WAQ84327.1 hypothetical protein PtA15_4A780 [Puccinia triticina]